MIALALAFARAWVRIYSCGLTPAVRDRRRAEIDSDLWEQRHEGQCRCRRAFATAWSVLGRLARGAPADLAWRIEHRAHGRAGQRLRQAGTAARRQRWTVFPAVLELMYITGALELGTPGFVEAPEQVAMAAGAAAIFCGIVLLWRGSMPTFAAWLICVGGLAPTLMLVRSVPLSLLWAVLAMRAAVRRSEALRAEQRQVAAGG
jgi:hypothetical protein